MGDYGVINDLFVNKQKGCRYINFEPLKEEGGRWESGYGRTFSLRCFVGKEVS